MADVFQPPKFSVVVWLRKTDNYGTIRSKLLELAAAEPDEVTEFEGMTDFHRGFDRESGADEAATAFREIVERPEVVVLQVISRDDQRLSKTLKDEFQ
ncbi:MAG: hypothetical protein WA459_24700 [Stellaceae bacterium]